jgi:hypothetical protein
MISALSTIGLVALVLATSFLVLLAALLGDYLERKQKSIAYHLFRRLIHKKRKAHKKEAESRTSEKITHRRSKTRVILAQSGGLKLPLTSADSK